MITPRDFAVIQFICIYYCVTRAMIQQAILPGTDPQGRTARKILNKLCALGLINKTRMLVCNPADGAPAPVYFPSRRGCELLATELRDDRWLATCTLTPQWQVLHHWVNIAKFRILVDQAAALSSDVKIDPFVHEWDVLDPDAKEPEKRFRLFTEIRKTPRLVFAPDFGFLLSFRSVKKVFYGEIDRATTGIQAIASSKLPAIPEMLKQELHRRHFPDTNVSTFSVLHVTTSVNRRDALRRAIKPKDGASVCRFIAWPEITAESLLHGDLVYDCESGPYPLVKRPEGGAQ